jgi:hypothetical protein
MSDYDGNTSLGGLTFVTHKATEGTLVQHADLAARLDLARSQGIPVVGGYHVVRTPGNNGHGSIAAQVSSYLSYLDAHLPWWRSWPNWLHQEDLEVWPYDAVSAATGREFAAELRQADPDHLVVTYASRGQYGNQLANWPAPLWNADYRGSASGSYPGDGWTESGGSPAGWAPYSGQTPTFLQYTDTPYDRDAYRGSLDDLLTLTGGSGMNNYGFSDPNFGDNLAWRGDAWASMSPTVRGGPLEGEEHKGVETLAANAAALADLTAKVDALTAAVAALGTPTVSDAQVATLATKLAAALPPPLTVADVQAAVRAALKNP